jgi:hypothetical protein
MLDLLTTPSFREAVVRGSGRRDDGAVARALADLGSAQTRLESLDDDYYVRGVLAPHVDVPPSGVEAGTIHH